MNGKRKILTYDDSLGKRQKFLFNNTIKVLLEDEKNEIFDLASYETPSI